MDWRPESVADADVRGLSYIVLDEIEGTMLGLAVSPWPTVDEKGRLRFEGSPVLFGAERNAFTRFLEEHREPRELASRPIRIGDVFGARVRRAPLDEADEEAARLDPVLPPEEWIEPPVYDLTAEAREAAKVSFYAAVAPALEPQEAAQLAPLVED